MRPRPGRRIPARSKRTGRETVPPRDSGRRSAPRRPRPSGRPRTPLAGRAISRPCRSIDAYRGRLCGPANEFYSRSESATPDPSGNDRDAEPPPPASNRLRIGPDARSAVGGQSPDLAGVGPVVVWPVRRTLTKWRRPARRRSRRLGRDLAYGVGCWRGTWFGGRTRYSCSLSMSYNDHYVRSRQNLIDIPLVTSAFGTGWHRVRECGLCSVDAEAVTLPLNLLACPVISARMNVLIPLISARIGL